MIALFLARLGLSRRVAGVLAYVLPALAVALLVGLLWAILSHRETADDAANVETGRTIEREAAQSAIIEQVREAQDARIEVEHRTDDQRRADCLRRSRTPENC